MFTVYYLTETREERRNFITCDLQQGLDLVLRLET